MTPSAELVRLEIPATPAFVGVARTVVVAVATSVDGIDDDRLEDLRIAVSEACTNAVETRPASGADRRVVLRCLVDDAGLTVHIADAGGAPVTPGDGGSDTLRTERGWGVQLIRALVDDVTFDDLDAVALTMRLGAPGR
jgi:serine/threonine-protein kinase RsbW